jgi:hypothetical protein
MFPQEIIDWMEEMAPLVMPVGSEDWEMLQSQCSGYLNRANGQLSWMNFVEQYTNNVDATRLVMQKALTEARKFYERMQECIRKQELEKQQGRELFQRLKAKRG